MNLVNDPWIPVVMLDGTSRLVSLHDVFKDGESIADLAANPCQRIALMRLLICITQAALDGPKDEQDWLACRPRIASATLTYLDRWRHRFNLFGEHAFLQVDGLDTETNALADKLDLTLVCGNSPTLFDHNASPDGRVHSTAILSLNLLVFQSFSCGGTFSTTSWNGQPTPPNGVRRSPCLEEAMAHTLLRCKDLADTIHLNLIPEELIRSLPNMVLGRPCWEEECLSKSVLEKSTVTFLGRLVPVSRAIHIIDNSPEIVLGEAMHYPQIPEQRDPFGTVYDTEKTRIGKSTSLTYLSANPDKHVWRELASILSLQTLSQSIGTVGAFNLGHLRNSKANVFDVWVGGLAVDQAKLLDMCEWNFSLSSTLLDSLVLARYQKGVDTANTAKQRLVSAVKTYALTQKCDSDIWKKGAENLFWGHMDSNSYVLQESLSDDKTLAEKWIPIIRTALHTAYERTCPHETPRQIQAYAQGLKILDSWKDK